MCLLFLWQWGIIIIIISSILLRVDAAVVEYEGL